MLDHGVVQLLDWMGDDLRIVNAAQASLDNESEPTPAARPAS